MCLNNINKNILQYVFNSFMKKKTDNKEVLYCSIYLETFLCLRYELQREVSKHNTDAADESDVFYLGDSVPVSLGQRVS